MFHSKSANTQGRRVVRVHNSGTNIFEPTFYIAVIGLRMGSVYLTCLGLFVDQILKRLGAGILTAIVLDIIVLPRLPTLTPLIIIHFLFGSGEVLHLNR